MKSTKLSKASHSTADQPWDNARVLEIVTSVARKQMFDRIHSHDFDELVNEAFLGVLEAKAALEARGKRMYMGLVHQAAEWQLIRYKLRKRSVLSIPSGSLMRAHRNNDIRIANELHDDAAVHADGGLDERQLRLRMVQAQVVENLTWTEKLVFDALLNGGSPSDAWRLLEEQGLKSAKNLAYNAVKRIKSLYTEKLGADSALFA